LIAVLAPGKLLSPLLARRVVAKLPCDVQLREGNHVHVYCGLTRLLDAEPVRGGVRVSAHATYRSQTCGADLFRVWSLEEGGFADAAERYFSGVTVREANVGWEGAVQAAWGAVTNPWTPFDREAVLGYADTTAQTAGRAFPGIRAARKEVERIRTREKWAALPDGKVGAELDQLAVDDSGRLVLLELKHAGASASSVYYSPLQLLQYVHEWAKAFDSVRSALRALIDARKAIGLSPLNMPDLARGLRPVIGFGPDVRSPEVRARFEEVLSIANRHLPPDVSPIEVWTMTLAGRPIQVS
jgi:hypothetical protein